MDPGAGRYVAGSGTVFRLVPGSDVPARQPLRCRGLARRLVGTALDWARRSGVRTVTLRMAPDNRVARSLYEGFGFTEVPGDGPGEVGMELSFG